MATLLSFARDINTFNSFALKLSDTKYSATLAAATDTTLTVPGSNALGIAKQATKGTLVAKIKYSDASAVWVAVNGTAAVPAGATFAATTSALNPDMVIVQSADVLHFITAAANIVVSVSFYWID